MRPEPTLAEKIETLADEGELTGFEGQLRADGRMTPELKNQIEMRRHELRTMKGWK